VTIPDLLIGQLTPAPGAVAARPPLYNRHPRRPSTGARSAISNSVHSVGPSRGTDRPQGRLLNKGSEPQRQGNVRRGRATRAGEEARKRAWAGRGRALGARQTLLPPDAICCQSTWLYRNFHRTCSGRRQGLRQQSGRGRVLREAARSRAAGRR
jgi:hypothetical protein